VYISSTILFRKAIAGFLLALLVFVYAEKSFHIHEKANSSAEQTGISITANNTGCSICNFTIAKDAELPEPTGTVIPSTFIGEDHSSVLIAYNFKATNTASDRGPPSF